MSLKVVSGNDVFAIVSNPDPKKERAEAQAVIDMHKDTKSGHRKETKISTMQFQIVEGGEYPPKNPASIVLGYKPHQG
jgi:hypothetical protein